MSICRLTPLREVANVQGKLDLVIAQQVAQLLTQRVGSRAACTASGFLRYWNDDLLVLVNYTIKCNTIGNKRSSYRSLV